MTIDDLLYEAVNRKASDLHVTVGAAPTLRINGNLQALDRPIITPVDTERLFRDITSPEQRDWFCQTGELDTVYFIPQLSRFRVNAFRQRGTTALSIRIIPQFIPTLEALGHPEVLKRLATKSRGLVLVTGATGCGKSTTLAAMIDFINKERYCHILTLEDPIEYMHSHKRSIVNQREIHSDTKSFSHALRAALREDPDVILVGEMRDAETIGIAITAAETGHLVLATLHTSDAAGTIDRIIDTFPPYQQQQIRVQLSQSLQGIVTQQLLLIADGTSRVAALEILVATPAVRNLIREGKTFQIASVLQTGAKAGMQSMDMSLRELYRNGIVTYEEALAHTSDPDAFSRLVNR
mgnify:CR=1 FL=1